MSTVTEYLHEHGIDFEAIEHGEAHTALQEALQLGVGAERVAKAVVLDTPDGHAVAVVASDHRLDLTACQEALGSVISLASEEELTRDFPQFEPGAFPAVPSMLGVPFVVDPEIMRHESVIVAGGDPRHSVRVATAEVFDTPGVTVTPIAREEDDLQRHHR